MAEKVPRSIKLEDGLEVEQIDLLTDLLIKERKSVLFVGEGDFSFTVAFAALRESEKHNSISGCPNPGIWDGIIATQSESTAKIPQPNFQEVLATCKKFSGYYWSWNHGYEGKSEEIEELEGLTNTPPPPGSWKCGVNTWHVLLTADVIWLQCPWNESGSLYVLIRYFLDTASCRAKSGDFVCIGITKHQDYARRYNLKKLLLSRKDKIDAVMERYAFCGADDKLVESVLSFGYHHEGVPDIHRKISKDHVTLVFSRK